MTGTQRLDEVACRRRFYWGAWRVAAAAFVIGAFCGTRAVADDWPAYRHDAARSGITSERVAPPLRQRWVFQSQHAPRPAWDDPKPVPVEGYLELRRFHFDDVFQPVAAGGAVYFGSSADNKVYCLDAATGRIRWSRITGGPVRLAPTVAGSRVFFGSDDGYAYCLDAGDGSVIWKFHGAPEDRYVLGHGKMISLWPLRTGLVVDDGIAYFGAGIFPGEGVFLYAVSAESGEEIWRNDTCGELPQSKISPQGYMLASESNLYVPMGRVSPARFERSTGRLAQGSPFFGKSVGGSYALLAGTDMYTGTEEIVGPPVKPQEKFATYAGRKMVVTDEVAYLASDTELTAMDRKKGPGEGVLWKIPSSCADSLILAGDVLFAGGPGQIIAVDAGSGKQVWTGYVEGTVKGLAAADGMLLASTDKGKIYGFATGSARTSAVATGPINEDPYADSPLGPMFERAAERILAETGARRGFCLVLGCETGQLALELAKRSELMIYAVSPDGEKVAAAREALDAAGVYGARVCVEQWPLEKVPYADYFANLVVSESAMVTGRLPDAGEVLRMLKPLGGTVMIGQPAGPPSSAKALGADAIRSWFGQSEMEGGQFVTTDGNWAKVTRGGLPGAGNWTHQYANTGNTACGDDLRINAPLGVLWFGNPGPGEMVSRHQRAAAPLSMDGRLFIQGDNRLMAYDAYNGVELWRREIPGAVRVRLYNDCGNLAVSHDGLFMAVDDQCLRLDPATGETQATYQMPEASGGGARRWAYIGLVGNLLFGSRGIDQGLSDCLFALDVKTGDLRWAYERKEIPHNTLAIGDGQVFVVSGDVTPGQRLGVIEAQRARIRDLPEAQRAKAQETLAEADVRLVASLDVDTGRVRWQRPLDLTGCGGYHAGRPDRGAAMIGSMYNEGVLIFFGMYLDGHYWKQFFAGEFESRQVIALAGDDGEFLWARQVGFRVRPVIVGDTLHTEPWAFDLHTGEQRTRVHPVTGATEPWQFARPGHHCGCPNASPNCLFFRSYNMGYYDLKGDYGTMHFGAQRSGCWINAIPAAGLLLVPEASAGCMCAFPNMCSIAFQPTQKQKAWAYYSAVGPMTPVKRLALNFGAPGDRNDTDGNLWLGYPRPNHRLVLQFEVPTEFYPGGAFAGTNSTYTPFAEAENPWLFASAAKGLKKCTIGLMDEADGTALYRVRLAFADPENDRPGQRVFDVKLQGKVVQQNFDVVEAAGGKNRAVVREFAGIEAGQTLVIELVPNRTNPTTQQLPILQGVEILRQRVLTAGCSLPEFELSNAGPRQSGQIELANLREESLLGTLELIAPTGFEVSPAKTEIRLDGSQRTAIPVTVTVGRNVPAGDYQITAKLVRRDGSEEFQRTCSIRHLGPRGRVTLRAVESAYVTGGTPDGVQAAGDTLWVDGGSQAMGDADHRAAYLKFRLDVPGKPLSAVLRIHNGGNPTRDSGRICLVTEPWSETTLTYRSRPKPGKELVRLGAISENQVVQCSLPLNLTGTTELSLVIEPTSTDGVDYRSRESSQPPELIVDYEP